jgi:hypothetical protein
MHAAAQSSWEVSHRAWLRDLLASRIRKETAEVANS